MIRSSFNGKNTGSRKIVKNLSDNELLDLVQRQTLKYFWDFAHPVSFMARERSGGSTDYDCDNTVTTGGTGFGIMALIAGVERGWLSRAQVRKRIGGITEFLERAEKYHGVFPHFLDGRTGKTIPFSPGDDGADLAETSFLMMGLLCARQYFQSSSATEVALRNKIDALWKGVEWNRHVRDDKLLWHWSPRHGWAMNHAIEGWNECLVTHLLAAASPTHPVSKDLYEQSWTGGADFKNGRSYYGIPLPLGPDRGGPLFFSHYSFLGLNPNGLKDKHADYGVQNRNHVLINRAHCLANPQGYKGYGPHCWGLTASDNDTGYDAHSPANDKGIISPTAALSSFPYTPAYSMQALRHFYEDLGDKIWSEYGFTDAFSESRNWYSKNHLAIDQGPIVVMIENYRSGLLWKLFMSCPEIKRGLTALNFESPIADSVNPQQSPSP